MIGAELEVILNKAIRFANKRKHEFLTLENVLYNMVDDEVVVSVLNSINADIEGLKDKLLEFLNEDDHFSLLSEIEIDELNERQFANEKLREMAAQSGIRYQPEISQSLQRVIQRAALHVQSSGKKSIQAINLLVAMFSEKESHAVFFLENQGITRLKLVEKIAHGVDRSNNTSPAIEDQTGQVDPLRKQEKYEKVLKDYTTNLTEMAKDGKLDPVIGRESEITRMTQILNRRRKNNPILVGDAGVGKTALAEGLAQRIVDDQVPLQLKNAQVYALDMAALLAGTKFRGDFEERLKQVLEAIQRTDSNADQAHISANMTSEEISKEKERRPERILFIDEIHTIIGAGSTSGGSMDVSNLLKPSLSRGEIRCIGSTTYDEFRKIFEKDQALARRFQKIDVNEPSIPDSIAILKGLKTKFEDHHRIQFSDETLELAVKLAQKHIHDRKLPDKAIDVIDETGAYLRLKNTHNDVINVTTEDIEAIVSQIGRIPKRTVAGNEKNKLKNLERDLKLLIYGQDEAVQRVVDAIILSRSGLRGSQRPIASFLFAGPTGVGKTELAKQLAQTLGVPFFRLDMSEYMEKHSVAKLIGAPPGYVGHEQGGILTEEINQRPYTVCLLDEIEKAHPDIFNILLQIMDHGKLTDSNGRSTDFSNVVLILTSNAGAKEYESGSIGLGGVESETNVNVAKRDQAIKNTFSPEFRNRLDAIVHFNKLGKLHIERVVRKFLMELENQLLEKSIELSYSDDLVTWLADVGFDPQLGARPIRRVIEERIKKPLASTLLFDSSVGESQKHGGGKIFLSLKNEKVIIDTEFKELEPVS